MSQAILKSLDISAEKKTMILEFPAYPSAPRAYNVALPLPDRPAVRQCASSARGIDATATGHVTRRHSQQTEQVQR